MSNVTLQTLKAQKQNIYIYQSLIQMVECNEWFGVIQKHCRGFTFLSLFSAFGTLVSPQDPPGHQPEDGMTVIKRARDKSIPRLDENRTAPPGKRLWHNELSRVRNLTVKDIIKASWWLQSTSFFSICLVNYGCTEEEAQSWWSATNEFQLRSVNRFGRLQWGKQQQEGFGVFFFESFYGNFMQE